jgi:hypothetical protein
MRRNRLDPESMLIAAALAAAGVVVLMAVIFVLSLMTVSWRPGEKAKRAGRVLPAACARVRASPPAAPREKSRPARISMKSLLQPRT